VKRVCSSEDTRSCVQWGAKESRVRRGIKNRSVGERGREAKGRMYLSYTPAQLNQYTARMTLMQVACSCPLLRCWNGLIGRRARVKFAPLLLLLLLLTE
jgi:hypothetical protein